MLTPYADLPFYPGPVSLHPDVADALARDYGPPRFGGDFAALYRDCAAMLQKLAGTQNEVILPTGEAMLGLWGALTCTLKPGDPVVCVGTGVFGDGFADMAAALGCIVEKVSTPYNATITPDVLARADAAIRRLNPVMLTAVHCETPSGTLNPLAELGALKKDRGVPLFTVDAVASLGGAPVLADAWNVDILLGGSQKCLACPPDVTIMAVSEAAWARMADVRRQGYDALLPFHNAAEDPSRFPYTPHWRGVAAVHASASALLREGLPAVFDRHERTAAVCREGLARLGIELWPAPGAVNSPTVTAALAPERWTWPEWRDALAESGLVVGGSLGPMAGKVFRLGHMGPQADPQRMARALDVMAETLRRK